MKYQILDKLDIQKVIGTLNGLNIAVSNDNLQSLIDKKTKARIYTERARKWFHNYYIEHRSEIIQRVSAYFQANKLKIYAYRKQKFEEDKEKVRQYKREYYQKTIEDRRAYFRAYYQAHKEKYLESQRKYRAKKVKTTTEIASLNGQDEKTNSRLSF